MRDLCTQSALPLLPPPLRLLLAPWGYPPARARLTDLRRAAHQGDVSAQFTLGWMYEHGDDVPQDHREAATWYTRAADQDNAMALNVVGVLYATGKGVPKDPREAVIWYHRAADIGYAPAQYNLGRATYNGDGTPLDRELAATWYTRAAAQGHQQAQRMIDTLTVRPLPGSLDPYEPSTDDVVLIQRASERAAAAYSAAHQAARHADTTLDRAAQILGLIVAAANVLDRHEQNRSAVYSRLYQTITNLDRTAERTNHRLQAIIKALKHRDKETIAIEARLRQTMIDRIGDPQGVPADDDPANETRTVGDMKGALKW